MTNPDYFRLQLSIDRIVDDEYGMDAVSVEDQAYYMDFKTEANVRAFIDWIAGKYSDHPDEIGAFTGAQENDE